MKNATDLIQNLRENSDTLSYFMLGHLYERGELLPRDLGKAIEYYNKASSINVPDMDPLAMKYKIMAHYNSLISQAKKHGIADIDKNIDLSWLEEAEQYGDAEILYRLGTLFEWGIIFAKNGDKAFRMYSMAYNHKHPDATCRLAGLYVKGFGCIEDENKSQVLAKEAEQLGSPSAKFLVDGEEYVTICPNEEWLTRDEVGTYGAVFGNSYGFEMLHSVVEAHSKTLDTKKTFCIDKELTSPSEYNIMFFLQKLSFWGVRFATYTVAVYALSRLNTYAQEKEALLSGAAFKLPALFGDSSVIESYVKLYVWTQAWLSRAKIAGANVSNEHLALEKHKDKVEGSCQNIYTKYKILAEKDDQIWKQALRLIAADIDDRVNNRPLVMVPENTKTCLEHAIKNSHIAEYRMWQQCIFDDDELDKLHTRFFNYAVRNNKFDEAKAFINEFEFDINYLIDGLNLSPLEFLIKNGFDSEACKIIRRANVDVNYNSVIFTAILKGSSDIIYSLLNRHDLNLDVKYKFRNESLTPLQLAKKHDKIIAQIFSDHIKNTIINEHDETTYPTTVSDLYFQYSGEYETTSINRYNVDGNSSASSNSYNINKYKS